MMGRSLRTQLVTGVSVIVSAALIGVGAVAVMGLRNEVNSLADSQLTHSLAAFDHWYVKAERPAVINASGPERFAGQAPGTVISVMPTNGPVSAVVIGDGEPAAAPPDVAAELASIDWHKGGPRTVRLGRLGPHRVAARELGNGQRLVSAVSLEEPNRALARNTLIVATLVLVALLATALGTLLLVRHALRPLRRVAAIASDVATLPLEPERHRITARVDERDTDPRTEVGVVGHTLNQMLDNVDSTLTRMAESDRNTRQFLTDASHELRTPLAAILGYAELTRQESEVLPPMTEYALERIEAEARRMSELVSDLLLLSRLGEGQDLHVEDVDLCDLVAHAVNDAAVSAPDHTFAVDLPDRAVWLRGDRARLHQLVANLLANAGIHTPAGVTVTTAVSMRGAPVVELSVRDDGPGIPEEIRPNLFGRFVRADKGRSRESGSTGLGLAIVASIVEAHHGQVEVESRPGRTVFTVLLPVDPPDRRRWATV